MSELVWIHRFNANELGLGDRGSFCLVPKDARVIFFPDNDFDLLEQGNGPDFEIYLSNIDQKYKVGYTKPLSKTEHRLSLAGEIRNYIGKESTGKLITPGKIGCFYRKDGAIFLTIAEEGSAYDRLLHDFPSRGKANNLITETVLTSVADSNNSVSEPKNSYTVSQNEHKMLSFKKSMPNTIYYGAPGTGKSYTIKEKLKSIPKERIETVTFHPDYDYTSFVGGYRPISVTSENGEDSIKYKFVPQIFTNMYVKAWQNPEKDFYLVIEEINRGNCAEIFGDIFQLLDQNQEYSVTPSSEMQDHLIDVFESGHEGIINGLKMPRNLSILATMNTSDQSLFPMDSAFKRRWDWEYIPIDYEKSDTNPSSNFKVYFANGDYFCWIDFIKAVNTKIKSNPNLGMDKCIGNYFIKPNEDSIILKTFINKAVFYLWNDVFKDEFGSESIFLEDITYEDFFPIEINGELQVRNIISNLEIEVVKVVDDA